LAAITFLFPIQLINKYIFAKCEGQSFNFSSANLIDMTIFSLVLWWWKMSDLYTYDHLDVELFGDPEDSLP